MNGTNVCDGLDDLGVAISKIEDAAGLLLDHIGETRRAGYLAHRVAEHATEAQERFERVWGDLSGH